MTDDPGAVAAYDQAMSVARDQFPDESETWREVWLRRAAHYLAHDGDMTGAPDFPDEERE